MKLRTIGIIFITLLCVVNLTACNRNKDSGTTIKSADGSEIKIDKNGLQATDVNGNKVTITGSSPAPSVNTTDTQGNQTTTGGNNK